MASCFKGYQICAYMHEFALPDLVNNIMFCQTLFSIMKILKYKAVCNITYAKRCWNDDT